MLHPSLHPQHLTQDRQPYFRRLHPLHRTRRRDQLTESSWLSTLSAELHWELCEDIVNDLNGIHDISNPNWLLSRPSEATYMAKRQNWLLSRPLRSTSELTPFKTPTIFGHKAVEHTPPAVNCLKIQHNSVILKPLSWIYTVFQSPWETTCKISMGNYLQKISSKPPTKWILDLFGKIKRRTHRMHLVNSSQTTSLACPTFGATAFAKMHSFKDPKTSHTSLTAITMYKHYLTDSETGQGHRNHSHHIRVHTHHWL